MAWQRTKVWRKIVGSGSMVLVVAESTDRGSHLQHSGSIAFDSGCAESPARSHMLTVHAQVVHHNHAYDMHALHRAGLKSLRASITPGPEACSTTNNLLLTPLYPCNLAQPASPAMTPTTSQHGSVTLNQGTFAPGGEDSCRLVSLFQRYIQKGLVIHSC